MRRPIGFIGALTLATAVLGTAFGALAQQPLAPRPVLARGEAVVTGFSGVVAPDPRAPLPRGKSAIDLTLIDPNGPSARIVDLANPGHVWDGRRWQATKPRDIFAKDVGQVFGVALDDAPAPNIYLSATSAFGLHLVRRGANGAVERLRTGGPRAEWQAGQFGLVLQGGPGAIYKVDGQTGAVSLFANVLHQGVPNPGAGLGGLAYDLAGKQLFASDLHTGMIHRVAVADGAETGAPFDHGVSGRAAVNAAPLPFDPRMRPVITNPAFDTANPESWGFAPPDRRVWGLAIHQRRLFYSVRNGAATEGPQIWSVGIRQDGDFAADPRWELDVPAQPGPYSVSDIAFSERGAMILAQRAPIAGSYDYTAFTRPGEPRVQRFWRESPDDPRTPSVWIAVPEEYAVGFAGTFRNSNGGVALGFGYDRDGRIAANACEASLWATGQNLRNDPALRSQLEPGGPLVVHGLQGSPAAPVRGFNEPPATSYFIDYDDRFQDPAAAGHLGSVRIRTSPCPVSIAYGGPGGRGPSAEPPYISGPQTSTDSQCPFPLNPDGTCGPIPVDLSIKKTVGEVKYDNATGAWTVSFTLKVTNVGNAFAPLTPIVINDAIPPGMTLVNATGTGWSACTGSLICGFSYGSGIFPTGATLPDLVVVLTTKTPGKYTNCAVVGLNPGSHLVETTLANNRDCAEVVLERKVDVAIKKSGAVVAPIDMPMPGSTRIFYTLVVSNVGGGFPGANAITVTDTPPAGVTFTSVSAVPAADWSPCAIVAGAVSCTYVGAGPVTPGLIGTITVLATATGKGPWENCATVAVKPEIGVETNLDDNKSCATLKVPEIDVSLKKKFKAGASPAAGVFTLTVKNEGDAIVTPATAIRIVDPVPTGVTLTGFSGTAATNWSCLPAFPVVGSATATLTCTYIGPPGTIATGGLLPDLELTSTLAPVPGGNEIGIYRNCATVGLTTGGAAVTETNSANNTDCAVTTIINTTDCSVTGNCPKPEAVCKQDVLFIVDASVSIGGGLGSVKAAIGQFLQAMQNQGGSANIFSFNGGLGLPSWTSIAPWTLVTGGNAATLAGPIALGGTRTNWDDALKHGSVVAPTAPLTGKPLVIFITDGEPTAYVDDTTGLEVNASTMPVLASSQAVPWINAIRAGGSPLIAVGFGSVASSGYLDAAFTGNSTGPGGVTLETASVIKMDSVGSLAGVMRTLGNQMCGTLSLNKSVAPNYRQHTLPDVTNPSLAVNDSFGFTLSLTNNAATPVTGVVVKDQVPAVLTGVVSTSPGVGVAGNLVTWTIPSVGARQTLTATFSGSYVRTYTAPADDTYVNYAQVTNADNYTATMLADMNAVSGPVNEPDESAASFRIRVIATPPPSVCDGANPPAGCFLSVYKIRANPGAEDGSCTSSPAGGAANPCTFNITVGLTNIPPGSTVTVSDALTLNGSSITWPGTVAPAICTGPTTVSFTCPHVGLTSFSGPVTVTIPPGQSGTLLNCVTVTVTNTSTTPSFNLTANSCASVTLAQAQGLLLSCPPGTVRQGGACLPIVPPPPICRAPLVHGPVAGSCVCPQGTVQRGAECVKLPPVCPAPLVPGAVAGSCVCPQDTVRRGRECVKLPPPRVCAAPLVPGPIAGSCVCPSGSVQRGRLCVKLPPPPLCRPPMVPGPVAGRCLCPQGTVQRGRECVRPIECRPPAKPNRAGTACLCPAGTIARGRECLPESPVRLRFDGVPGLIFGPREQRDRRGPESRDPRLEQRDTRPGQQKPAGFR